MPTRIDACDLSALASTVTGNFVIMSCFPPGDTLLSHGNKIKVSLYAVLMQDIRFCLLSRPLFLSFVLSFL